MIKNCYSPKHWKKKHFWNGYLGQFLDLIHNTRFNASEDKDGNPSTFPDFPSFFIVAIASSLRCLTTAWSSSLFNLERFRFPESGEISVISPIVTLDPVL